MVTTGLLSVEANIPFPAEIRPAGLTFHAGYGVTLNRVEVLMFCGDTPEAVNRAGGIPAAQRDVWSRG